MFATDPGSERANSIEEYQNTCTEFIIDISKDYSDWVDRYQLGDEETRRRKTIIQNVAKTTNEWINRFGTTIKKVDIIMNDGVNKMAENTAGYPFKYNVVVNRANHYVTHPLGLVRVNLKATPREGRLVRVGNYQKDQVLLIGSSSPVNFSLSKDSTTTAADVLDDYIMINTNSCQRHDVISVTAVVEEVEGDYVTESRGYSTLILLT